MVTFETFKEIIHSLEEHNIRYWVFGGWALDGARHKISREHGDIDMYVSEADILKLSQLLSSLDLELKQRENMYFVDSEKLQLGVVLVSEDDNKIIAHGNKTTAHYPKEIFEKKTTGIIEDTKFNSVPNEVLALEAQFSKYKDDNLLGAKLEIDKKLFEEIEIVKIRDSRNQAKN